MSIPFFFPPPNYVKHLPLLAPDKRYSLLTLCKDIGIPCRASGEWILREIYVRIDANTPGMAIYAEPGSCGRVLVILPKEDCDTDKVVLAIMAYALHDLVARQSIKKLTKSMMPHF